MLQERGELALAAKLASDLGLSSRKEISAEAAEAAAAVAAAKVPHNPQPTTPNP